jgi:hypothetical protein
LRNECELRIAIPAKLREIHCTGIENKVYLIYILLIRQTLFAELKKGCKRYESTSSINPYIELISIIAFTKYLQKNT